MPLLDLPVPSLSEILRSVGRALNAEYRVIGGDAFRLGSWLFPLRILIGRISMQNILLNREQASQATPFGATGSNLDAWLNISGVQVPPSAKATGIVSVKGDGVLVPAGTELASVEGLRYVLDADVLTNLDGVEVAASATEIGSIYNRGAGDILQLDTVLDDVDTNVTVMVMAGGSDVADDATKSVLLRDAQAQQSGSGTIPAYRLLCRKFSSIYGTIFIVAGRPFPGAVSIFPTLITSDFTVQLPGVANLAALETFLNADERRQINDRPLVRALTLTPHTFQIQITPDNTNTRASVTDALGFRLAESYSASGYLIDNSEINAAIGAAPGVLSHTLLDVNGNGSTADIVTVFGELATLGVITWV